MSADRLDLVALSKETVPQWLALRHASLDYGMTERKLTKRLTGHGARELVNYLVMDGAKPLAKMAGQINLAGCLEVWDPAFHKDLDEATAVRCTDLLLDKMLQEANDRPEVTYLEAKPSEDIPGVSRWLQHLQAAGFDEISVGHAYLLNLDPSKTLPSIPADLRFRPINEVPPDVVAEVYGRIINSTLDRADGSAPEEPIKRLESRKRIPFFDFHPANWLFCYRDGAPIGFIFTCLEKTATGQPTAALLMEGGIVPEARGQGLYTHLIRKGVQVAAARGCTRVYGRTDDQNFKPTAVLVKEGFERLPSRNWIFRRRLAQP